MGSQTPELQLPPPTPPASEYPADIIGRVTIAEKVVADKRETTPLGDDCVYWIVEVSVKNKEYEAPITSKYDPSIPSPEGVFSSIWVILKDGELWSTQMALEPPPMTVLKGQSGNTFLWFEGRNINPSDAQICYRGQEPYSYGKLTGGDKVVAYDWDSKAVITEQEKPQVIGRDYLKVVDIWGLRSNWGAIVYVQLESTSSTKEGYYDIELRSGKERFGAKEILWEEGRELATLEWQIGSNTRAWAEITRGEKAEDVFQVVVSYKS